MHVCLGFSVYRDKLEVTITVNIQYFLNKDDLAELHQEYDIFYNDVFKQTAKDVVKVFTLSRWLYYPSPLAPGISVGQFCLRFLLN